MAAAFDPTDPELSPALQKVLGRLDSVTSRLEDAVVVLEAVVDDPDEDDPQEKT